MAGAGGFGGSSGEGTVAVGFREGRLVSSASPFPSHKNWGCQKYRALLGDDSIKGTKDRIRSKFAIFDINRNRGSELNIIKLGILTAVASVSLAGTAQAACNSRTDNYGNTQYNCADGTSGSTRTDAYGNTTGQIGGQSINTRRDNYGNTTGSIGGESVNLRDDNYGNRTGSIGRSNVNTRTDSYGNTSGTVGNQSQNCRSDNYGNRTCN